jgi:hypothetical protein
MLIFPAAIVLQGAETKPQIAKLVEQKVDKKFVYPNLLKEVELDPTASTLSLQSLIGKPIHATMMVSADHSTSLVWIVGTKNKNRVIVIGIHNSGDVFLVAPAPRVYPKSFNYAEYPVWLPLDGGRLLYWGLDSRECWILDVGEVNSSVFSGYDPNSSPSSAFHSFDALDPTLSNQIKPYSFARTGPDDSSVIKLLCEGKRLVVKNGYSYLWGN